MKEDDCKCTDSLNFHIPIAADEKRTQRKSNAVTMVTDLRDIFCTTRVLMGHGKCLELAGCLVCSFCPVHVLLY